MQASFFSIRKGKREKVKKKNAPYGTSFEISNIIWSTIRR